MAEEQINQNEPQITQAQSASAENSAKKPTPLMKYIILGGIGLVVVLAIAFGTAFLLTDSKSTSTEEPPAQTTSPSPVADQQPNRSTDDSAIADIAEDHPLPDNSDEFAIDKIMDNLAFLDYKPSDEELDSPEIGISAQDSLEQMDWLTKEKAALEKRGADLDKRERDLQKLESDINKKLLIIEQAESNRIAQLAKLYDGMDSRAVARLLSNLDDNTVVAILPRMKAKSASEVLQLLPPQRAAVLSKKLITIAEN